MIKRKIYILIVKREKFETECGGYTFRILSVSGKMIQKVLVFKNNKTGDDNEAH